MHVYDVGDHSLGGKESYRESREMSGNSTLLGEWSSCLLKKLFSIKIYSTTTSLRSFTQFQADYCVIFIASFSSVEERYKFNISALVC